MSAPNAIDAYRDACAELCKLIHRRHIGRHIGIHWTSCNHVECVEAREIFNRAAATARKRPAPASAEG